MVDNDAEDRSAVAKLVKQMGLSCKEYQSGRGFLLEYERSWPGCLVMELRVPDINGLQIQHALIQNHVPLPVVFLTGYADAPTAVRAIRAGAVQFLEKPPNNLALWDAIQEAIDLDAQLRHEQAERQKMEELLQSLTSKERQVLELVLDGETSQRIARELDVCVRTVEIRRSSIMKKLKAKSLPELLKLATAAVFRRSRGEEHQRSPSYEVLRPLNEIVRDGNGNGRRI